MKKILSTLFVIATILLTACSSSGPVESKESAIKKLTLDDAWDILDLSTLLPDDFEELDSASEGLSNKDMDLGSDFSEVVLYLSDSPFQMIYGFMGIITSRIESASFDSIMEDEEQLKQIIRENIIAGAEAEGAEMTVPDIVIKYPNIGDASILGEGIIESSGFYFGFDTCWFRNESTYIFLYSLYMTEDKVDLGPLSESVNSRLANYSK